MKNILLHIYCVLAILLLSIKGQSQTIPPQNPFLINVLINKFWQNDSTAYLEISTACYPNQVTLYNDSAGHHKSIEFWIKIKNNSTEKIVQADRFRVPITMQDSSNELSSKSIVNKFTYKLSSGSYTLSVHGFDNGKPTHRDSAIIQVEIPRRPRTVALSDIELASNITESKDTKDYFYKNSLCVIPNPSLVFGKMSNPVVFHYFEVYNLCKDSLYTVEILVKDQNGEIKKSKRSQKHYGVKDAVEVGTTTIMNLSSGKYLYQVRILDGCMKEIVIGGKQLFINNPQVKQEVPTGAMKSVEFLNMTDDELTHEFKTAKYLATDQEIKTFSKLSNAEGRREFLAKFWSDIESGRHENTDLTRTIYLDRVMTANQRYHSLGREGWQTDRGRVYLLYAEPDEVERFPNQGDSKPYEIWHYNQIESGVIFVFIDRTGFGSYSLVHSTKRGEIQDDSWQQYLR